MAADRMNINRSWEHIQQKYVGTGHVDMSKFEWASNVHRDSIASHRVEEGGNGVVTLVLERSVDASTPLNTTRDSTPPRVEPLADVIKRDLQRKRVEDDLTKQVEGMSAAERTQRLLDLGFDVREDE